MRLYKKGVLGLFWDALIIAAVVSIGILIFNSTSNASFLKNNYRGEFSFDVREVLESKQNINSQIDYFMEAINLWSIAELIKEGNFQIKTDCGEYLGYPILNNEKFEICIKEKRDIKEEYKKIFISKFEKQKLKKFGDLDFSSISYELSIPKEKGQFYIKGNTEDRLKIPISIGKTKKQKVGNILPKPLFKIKTNYDFAEFDGIIDKAENIVNDCSKKDNVLGCIREKRKDFSNKNLKWKETCSEGAEKIFQEFKEFLTLCAESRDGDCVCSYTTPKDEYKFSIDASSSEDSKKFVVTFTDHSNRKVFKEDISIEHSLDYKRNIIPGQTLTFLKDPQTRLISQFTPKSKKPACIIKKEFYTFCVKSENKVLAYGYIKKDTKLRNIEYNFALKIPDTIPPPPIKNIKIKDNLISENSVLLIWDRTTKANEPNDVKDFIIYYSESDFKDKEIKNKEIEDVSRTDPISEKEKQELEDIDLDRCVIKDIGKPCNYGIYDKPLKKGNLYYWKKENKYIYVLKGLKDNKEYFFGVTAIDFEGNQMNNEDKGQKFGLINNNLPKGSSIDDLAPGQVIIKYEKIKSEKPKEIKLTWQRPAFNIDGTPFSGKETFLILYKKLDFTDVKANRPTFSALKYTTENFNEDKKLEVDLEDSNCAKSQISLCSYTLKNLESGIYDFGIVAKDKNGNFYEEFFAYIGDVIA